MLDLPWRPPANEQIAGNPLSRNYDTADGHVITLTCLQAGKYWAPLAECIGRPELATDPRFADHASLMANSQEAIAILSEVFAAAPLADWRERLDPFIGQWAVVQDTLEASVDPQTIANGYIQDCETADGIPFKLVAAPVQYDGEAAPRPDGRPSSTSTATPSWPSSGSTGTPSWTSRSAASWPEPRHPNPLTNRKNEEGSHDVIRCIPL